MEPGLRVLDIGSGNGLEVGRLIQRGVFAVGCDISPALLAIAKGNMMSHGLTTFMLVQWDGCHMPFASDTFDRVMTNTVLQHVVDDNAVESIFSETGRILKSEGLFLVCEVVSPQDMQTAPHVKLRSTRTYERIASRYGFRAKRIRHAVSTYVAIQSVYGRFRLRATSPSGETTNSIARSPRSQNTRAFAVLVKRAARKLVSGFAKIADQLITSLRFDDRFAGQDEMVFERQSG